MHVEEDAGGDEVIVMSVKNHQDKPFVIRHADISLTTENHRIMAPDIIGGGPHVEPGNLDDSLEWVVDGNEETQIKVHWPRCVRRCIWARSSMNGPVPFSTVPGKIGVTAWLRNSGALSVSVTDPQTIVEQDQQDEAQLRPASDN